MGPASDDEILGDLTEIAIGWFGPADAAHDLHGDLWTAATIAVDEANRTGGWKGLPFRWVARWSETIWGTGASQVARMAYDDGVWAILGSVDASTTHLAEQVVAKARLSLVSPVSTDPSVNLAGVPWMFSVVPGDHLWAPILAEGLIETLEDEDFTLITTTDHPSRLATQALIKALAELDHGPLMRLDIRPGSTDVAAQLAASGLSESGALLLVAGTEDGPRLLRAVRDHGFTGTIFAAPELARRRCLKLASNAAQGVRVPLLFDPVSTPEREAFARSFRQRTGSDPDWAALHTYDAARLLLEAARTAGPSRTAIRDAIAGLSPWQGVTGLIEWDPTGQNRRPVTTLATIRGGRLTVE